MANAKVVNGDICLFLYGYDVFQDLILSPNLGKAKVSQHIHMF